MDQFVLSAFCNSISGGKHDFRCVLGNIHVVTQGKTCIFLILMASENFLIGLLCSLSNDIQD